MATLAAAVGLHVTTVRGHLALLERAGLVRRTPEVSGVPGRPRQLYALVDEAQPQEGHRQLAEFLASVLAADAAGSQRAEEAGRRWAQAQLPNAEAMSWQDGTRRVVDLFEAMGFAPQPTDVEHRRRIDLHACPFRDVARAFPGIVCAVHRGLLRESLVRLGQPRAAAGATLDPFVEPDLCVVGIPMPAFGGSQV